MMDDNLNNDQTGCSSAGRVAYLAGPVSRLLAHSDWNRIACDAGFKARTE